jgi:hypothetical protein
LHFAIYISCILQDSTLQTSNPNLGSRPNLPFSHRFLWLALIMLFSGCELHLPLNECAAKESVYVAADRATAGGKDEEKNPASGI